MPLRIEASENRNVFVTQFLTDKTEIMLLNLIDVLKTTTYCKMHFIKKLTNIYIRNYASNVANAQTHNYQSNNFMLVDIIV